MPGVRLFLIGLCLLLALPAQAEEVIGRIKILRGPVTLIANGLETAATVGAPLTVGMVVKTGPRGRVGLTFADETRFALGPNSEVAVDAFRFDGTTHEGRFSSRIKRGTLSVVSGKLAKHRDDAMTVATPSSVIGVRGTTFLIKIDD